MKNKSFKAIASMRNRSIAAASRRRIKLKRTLTQTNNRRRAFFIQSSFDVQPDS